MAAAGFSTVLSMFGAMFLAGGIAGLPLGIPPAEPDRNMARVAPEECLFYMSWSGMAEASADSTNHTERLLAEPQVKRFIQVVTDRLNAALVKGAGEGQNARRVAQITPRIVTQMAVNPTAIFAGNFTEGPTGLTVPVGVVVNLGDEAGAFEKDLLAVLEILIEQPVPRAVKGVRTLVTPLGVPKIQWTIQDGYFILGVSDGTIAQIQERMSGDAVPQWLTQAHKRLPVHRVSSVTYVNTKDILEAVMPMVTPFLLAQGPEAGNPLNALGLTNLETIVNVTGLSETAVVSRTWLHIKGKPTGIFAMLNAEPIQAADLATIPADSTIAFSMKLNPEKTFDQFVALIDAFEPGSEQQIRAELQGLRGEIGFDLETDLFDSLGDTWTLYASPSENGTIVMNATAVVEVRNAARLRAVSDTIAKNIRNFEQQMRQFNSGRQRTVGVRSMNVGGHTVHFLNAIGEELGVAPAWCVTDKHVIFSLFPQGISAFLNRKPGTKSLATLPHIQQALQADPPPSKLFHVDSQAVCRAAYPLILIGANLLFSEMQREGIDLNISVMPEGETIARHLQPALTTVKNHEDGIEMISTRTLPVSFGVTTSVVPSLFLVSVRSSRMTRFGQPTSPGILDVLSPSRAARTRSKNNLKQLGIAMHNFHDTFQRFPAAATKDGDGKSLLSWRVKLLPFIDQAALFEEFHQDEPWDSPHNKALIARMPPSLMAPGSKAGEGKTNYVGILHKQGIFTDGPGTRIRDVVDGTSNTIMVAEVDDKHAVIWTKPDDLDFNDEEPHTGLVGLRKGGFLAVFCDGAVHFVPSTIDAQTLIRLVMRNDGQSIDFRQFQPGRRDRPVPTTQDAIRVPREAPEETSEGADPPAAGVDRTEPPRRRAVPQPQRPRAAPPSRPNRTRPGTEPPKAPVQPRTQPSTID